MGALVLGFLDFFKVCTRFYRYFVNIRINWVLFYKSLMSYYTTRNHYFPRHSDEGQRKRPHNWCLGKKSEISVSLICQGRKPKVLSTGPNFNTNSGSGKPCELSKPSSRSTSKSLGVLCCWAKVLSRPQNTRFFIFWGQHLHCWRAI